MKRIALAVALALSSLAVSGQNSDADVVAVVNGEKITKAQLDVVWNRAGEKLRARYEKSGGKLAFLNNYIGKRLLLQKAQQSGFDKSPAVQAELEAAREAALFDLYIREAIGAQFVDENAVRAFYDANLSQFSTGERAKVRTIFISTAKRSPSDARALAGTVMQKMFESKADFARLTSAFAAAAAEYSEHASAANGGDLGWVEAAQLDKDVAPVAFGVRAPGMSGLIETAGGYHLLLVEAREPAGTKTFEESRAGIREFLLSKNAQNVMDLVGKTTNDLSANAKVTVYADRVK